MKRRSFLSALLALPVAPLAIKGMATETPAPEPETDFPEGYRTFVDAEKLKYLLLPALYATFAGTGAASSIVIGEGGEDLIVTVSTASMPHLCVLGFIITKHEIIDGTYKSTFRPRTENLRDAVLGGKYSPRWNAWYFQEKSKQIAAEYTHTRTVSMTYV